MCAWRSIPMLFALRMTCGDLLVEREHEASLAAPRPFGDVLQAHDALADARDPGDDRRAAEEIAAVHHRIEAGNAGGHARRRIEGGGVVAAGAARRLHPPVHLDSPAVDDPERVPAHLKVVPARLDDLDRPHRGAEPLFHSQPDDRVGNRFFGQRDRRGPRRAVPASTAKTAVRFSRCSPSTRT